MCSRGPFYDSGILPHSLSRRYEEGGFEVRVNDSARPNLHPSELDSKRAVIQ